MGDEESLELMSDMVDETRELFFSSLSSQYPSKSAEDIKKIAIELIYGEIE
jgi:hypothetical protein